MVTPAQIVRGDVIEDPVGHRWLTVNAVRMLTDAGSGAYSFYGNGPHDRITFEGNERVRRRSPRRGTGTHRDTAGHTAQITTLQTDRQAAEMG